MRILFYLTRYPGIGGIEKVTDIVTNCLSKNHQVSVLSHISQGDKALGKNIIFYEMPDKKHWASKGNILFFEKLIIINNFDAVVYQDSYAPTEKIVCETISKYNIPLFVFEHNSPLYIYNKRDVSSLITIKGFLRNVFHPWLLHKEIKRKRYLLGHCKKYVLLSKAYVPEFCSLIGIASSDCRITYINNPIIPVSIKNREKENVILCVARLVREKQVDKMLEIWKLLSPKLAEWKFFIVGDGPMMAELKKKANNLYLKRITFIGYSNPTKYYESARIFWMTSKFEGWPLTLLEAMQYGCVPVAFNTFSSVSDIIDNSADGFVISNGDTQQFMDATLKIAVNSCMYDEMASRARSKINIFSIDRIMKKWELLLGA